MEKEKEIDLGQEGRGYDWIGLMMAMEELHQVFYEYSKSFIESNYLIVMLSFFLFPK